MRRFFLVFITTFLTLFMYHGFSQCQSQTSGNWHVSGTWTNCSGGTPTSTGLNAEILSGHTVTLANNSDEDYTGDLTVLNGGKLVWNDSKSNWTGSIDVETGGEFEVTKSTTVSPSVSGELTIDGTVNINAAFSFGSDLAISGNMAINAATDVDGNVTVKSGGLLDIEKDLNIGSSAGCGYTLDVQLGGTVDEAAQGSDLISICGTTILKGNGACNDLSISLLFSPIYCLNAGDILGPLSFSESGVVIPLAVHFTNVEIVEYEIIWHTSYEMNSSHFMVMGSVDGDNFHQLGSVESLNSLTGADYSYEIDPIFSYYQIVEVDENGATTKSKIVSIRTSSSIQYYPNPALDQIRVIGAAGQLLLINNQYSEIVNQTIIEEQDLLLDLSELTSGVYWMEFQGDIETQVLPLVIE